MIKCLVFDLDGTLLNDERKIDPKNLKAINTAIAKGIKIVLASGRNFDNMIDFCKDIKGVSYLICENGARIYDSKKKIFIAENLIPNHLSLEVFNFVKEAKLNGIFYTNKAPYLFNYNPNYKKALLHFKVKLKTNPTKDDLVGVSKILLLKEEGFTLAQKLLNDLLIIFESKLTIAQSSLRAIDINAINTNKGEALKQILALENINLSNVAGFGNGNNDIEFLKLVAKSFVMGNSLPAVLKVANQIIGNNNNNEAISNEIYKLIY